MIESTLIFLKNKLQEHFAKTDLSAEVKIDNIGTYKFKEGDRLQDKIVITLINVEEETTLQHLLPVHDRFDHILPFHYNLYILISSNYPRDYQLAIKRLDRVFDFFRNTPQFLFDEQKAQYLQFIAQLLPLNFEEINHLWNSLGVSHLPFMLYKLKVTESSEKINKG